MTYLTHETNQFQLLQTNANLRPKQPKKTQKTTTTNKQKDNTMNLTDIVTEPDRNKKAIQIFITDAQAGQRDSASKQQKAAYRLASLLHDLEIELNSLTESEVEGYLALVRLSAGRPVWDDQKIRVSLLIAAAVLPPDKPEPENLPSISNSIAQLVNEICDPESATIGGKTREEFDAEHSMSNIPVHH